MENATTTLPLTQARRTAFAASLVRGSIPRTIHLDGIAV
jgi:hypothetical protein